jgi:hypothetical protein
MLKLLSPPLLERLAVKPSTLWASRRLDYVPGDFQTEKAQTIVWDNAPTVVDIAVSIQKFPAAKGFKTIFHPPYMPDIAPPDFLLFPRMNSELPDLLLTQDSFTLS